MIKLDIGKNLKKYRNNARMTQQQVGALLGVNHRTVASWENNRTEPTIGIIEQLAQIYGCNKSDLIKVAPDIPTMQPYAVELLDLYNRATPEQREMVLNLLRCFVNPNNTQYIEQ